jgi:hypothetical protein
LTRDPKKFREIARVCAVPSKSAATQEERDTFATLAETWRGIAASSESRHALLDGHPDMDVDDLSRFDNNGRASDSKNRARFAAKADDLVQDFSFVAS